MVKKKKMLILGRGNEIGGGTEYIITIINMLREKFDVEIHMNYGKEEVRQNYQKYFDDIIFHKTNIVRSINFFKDLSSLKELVSLMRKEKFDVVHTNTSKSGVLGRFAAKISRVPFVFHTVHGFAFHEQSSKISIKIYSFIEKICSKFCDYIVTVSDFHRNWAIELGIAPKDKIISIPNGLDPNRIRPMKERDEVRTELGIAQEEVAIFTIGRLAKQKGLEYLLEAIALLNKDDLQSNYKFYIAGSGELESELKNKARQLNIEHKLKFLGFRKDVNNLLEAADILVIPSLWEGLSIALLEAMAAKKAIICTNIGSNLTVVRNGKEAIMVNCKDSKGIKENLMKLLLNKENLRVKLSSNAYQRFNEEFNKDKMIDRYFRFYKEKVKISEKI
ncbi:glycosyltransferase family 4 protein [uncultured Ilyobacter sp.]|uniref:glycosyltransferase family 4 protein n=1 Tax=uncultured Ilyobacter sp. TaxID=544433 RepID=UPI0029C8E64B|nr:glycosyltransferase family 4 protein [uncultured Ilyobacter sp.]